MERGGWGEPNKYPNREAVETRLEHICMNVRDIFKGSVSLYSCYSYETKAGKASPRPKGTEADPRWDPANRKPKPGMLLTAMKDLQVSPSETIFIGDMITDEEAAKSAGVSFQYAVDFFQR